MYDCYVFRCSNKGYARQERDIRKHTDYSDPVLKTSFFDCSILEGSPEALLSEIERISSMLYDTNSKITHIVSWLSRISNNEDVTNLFESEYEIPELSGDTVNL